MINSPTLHGEIFCRLAPDSPIHAKRHYLAFLQRHEFYPAATLCNILQAFQLPSENCRRADITRLAGLNYIVQGFERVEAVNLINVDVIKLQTLQAVVNLRYDVLTGRAAAVRSFWTHFKIHLCRHDNFITVKPEVFDVATGDFFARAHLVNARRVKTR